MSKYLENPNIITNLNSIEARDFLLKPKSYCSIDMPSYFDFASVINNIISYNAINNSSGNINYKKGKNNLPSCMEGVNYKLYSNKDGKFAWRPLQLIHPVLYVDLVNNITIQENWEVIKDRFRKFQSNDKIGCYSLPVKSMTSISDKAASINLWWERVELKSIELALKYEFLLHTDIANCYGSIYTHSIAWAIHDKEIAKNKRSDASLIGNIIDKQIRDMSSGQTNGIPQGSVLMDFIAEIVLGYVDLKLSDKINGSISDYEIIRYRDDYKIFSNNAQNLELITKYLTEILIDLGMHLNAAKTKVTNKIIRDSIKPEKYYWITESVKHEDLYKQLLIIHKFSDLYPNSGHIKKVLDDYYVQIINSTEEIKNTHVLISILVDIMFLSPIAYPIATAILSNLLSRMPDTKGKIEIIKQICKRFERIPNLGHLEIWLQRITLKIDPNKNYNEQLCKKVVGENISIWNSEWLNPKLIEIINNTSIINKDAILHLDNVISHDEVKLFKSQY